MRGRRITLNDMFEIVGLDYEKARRIVSDNISDTRAGQYLDNLYNILEKRYELHSELLSEEVKKEYMRINKDISEKNIDKLRNKKLIRK